MFITILDMALFAVYYTADIWRRRRKILAPTFAPRYVNSFVSIFEAQSKVTADLLEPKVGKGNVFVFDYFSRLSLDSVCESLFDMNIDAQRNPTDQFLNAFIECQKIVGKRLLQPWLLIDAVFKWLPMHNRLMNMAKIIHEFMDNLVQKKRVQLSDKEEYIELQKESDTRTDEFKPKIKSFLELMIENLSDDGKTYTNKELREELIGLALAGTDTSAIGVSFTVLLLSQHTYVQDKVYKEIQEVLGDSDEPLSFEKLQNLKYLKAVIKETLRLYPPAPLTTRKCEKEVTLGPDLTIPKDSNVIITILGIQRNPEYWGEDADDFNPDRFMSGQTNPNAFLAFGHGTRNCIGQHYGMLSMMTTLVTLLRRYRFTPAANFKYGKDNPLRLSYDIMMKHVENFPVQIEYRDQFKGFITY